MSVASGTVYVVDELVERVDAQDRVLGVVSRKEAVRAGWLHRVGVVVCRDRQGRFLVHRRAERLSRFPGHHELGVGGAAGVGESYEQAAARELGEELGVRAAVRPRFTFLNRVGLSPHWLGVCDAVLPETVVPDPEEVAWHGWLTRSELRRNLQRWTFTPDSREIFDRYLAHRPDPAPPRRGSD
ncbi:NUDIX domain-containing protein [Streptomyces sediminimaris]|uniref:NUDIX domain-containing protein n=1 Tax=Streptomyces sediminimaris TaxID=3383721 RepID=UPI00399BDE18